MKRITVCRVVDGIVFAAALLLVAALSYRGMAGTVAPAWIGVLVVVMDSGFILSTALHLTVARPQGIRLALHVISAVLIVAAVAQKLAGVPFAVPSLLLWNFYILLFYGYSVVCIDGKGKNQE